MRKAKEFINRISLALKNAFLGIFRAAKTKKFSKLFSAVRVWYLYALYFVHLKIRLLHDRTYERGGWYKKYSDKGYTQALHKSVFTAFVASFATFLFLQYLWPLVFNPVAPRSVQAGSDTVTWTTQEHFNNNGAPNSNYTGATTYNATNVDMTATGEAKLKTNVDETYNAFDYTINTGATGTVDELAVNPVTNKVYVTCGTCNYVKVINAATNAVTGTIYFSGATYAVGVNTTTNRIYVLWKNTANNWYIGVINGATDAVITSVYFTNTSLVPQKLGFAVNETLNRYYFVLNYTLYVYEGVNNTYVWGQYNSNYRDGSVGVNPVTGKVYVGSGANTTLCYIFDENNGYSVTSVATPGTGYTDRGLVVNPSNDKVYLATSSKVYVMSGVNNSYAQLVGGNVYNLSLNTATNNVHVGTNTAMYTYNGSNSLVASFAYSNTYPSWSSANPGTRQVYVSQGGANVGVINLIPGYTTSTVTGYKIDSGNGTAGIKSTWNTISRVATTPTGTAVKFRTRGAESEGELTSAIWSGYYSTSSAAITTLASRWLEIELTLETTGTNTPTLNDFTVVFDTLETPSNAYTYLKNANGALLLKSDGQPLEAGSFAGIAYTSESTVRVQNTALTCTGCSSSINIRPQVELKPIGTSFDGTGLYTASPGNDYYDITNLSSGSYHLRVRSVDDQGRVSSWTTFGVNTESEPDLVVEQNAPTGTLTIDEGSYTKNSTINLTLAANDTGGSGLSKMRFSNNGTDWSTWEDYNTTKSWTVTSGDGQKKVYAQFSDNAGNVSGTWLQASEEDFASGQVTGGASTSVVPGGITLTASASLNIRPNGAGNYSEWSGYYPATVGHWDKVDEEVINTGDYVYSQQTNQRDLYNFQNPSLTSEQITGVTVHCNLEGSDGGGFNGNTFSYGFHDGTGEWFGSQFSHYTGTYTCGQSFANNPRTSSPWTVSQLNSLQAGLRIDGEAGVDYFLYQFYVTVSYVPLQVNGEFVSSPKDNTTAQNYGAISWIAETSPQAGADPLIFQVASNNDNATWNYIGPDGTSGTYYNTSGTQLHSSHNGARYIRYKAYLQTENSVYTPVVSDVLIEVHKISDSVTLDTGSPIVNSNAIVKPNGGESWGGGTTKTVEWNSGSAADATSGLADRPVTLYYSTNSDSGPWYVIDNSNNVPIFNDINAGCTPTAGGDACYTWKIPNSITSTQMKLKIEFRDKADNRENDISDNVFQSTADLSAPTAFTIYSSSPKSGVWKNATPTLDWSDSTDPDSGIDHYEVWMSQEPTPSYPSDFSKISDIGSGGNLSQSTATLDLSGEEGTWYYFIRATNGAYDPENKATYTDSGYGVTTAGENEQYNTQDNTSYFRVDDTAPTGTLTLRVSMSSNSDATSSPVIDLHLAEDDGSGSGTTLMKFSNDNVTFCSPEGYDALKAGFDIRDNCIGGNTLTQRGTRTVYARLIDAVGNTSNVFSDDIIYDTTNPSNPNLTSAVVQGGVVSGSTNTVRVTWQVATDPSELSETVSGVAGYNIYRSEDSVSGYAIISDDLVPAGTLTFDDDQATDGVTYYYRVQSVDNADNSSNHTAQTAVSVSLTDLTPPSPMSSFIASGVDSNTIGVSWSSAIDNGSTNNKKAAQYVVERSKEAETIIPGSCTTEAYNQNSQYDALKTVPIGNNPPTSGVDFNEANDQYSFSDANRTLEKWYCYRAKAIDAALNESGWSYFPARGNSAPTFVDMGSNNFVNLAVSNGHDSETARPGDTITVTFKITDPEGFSDLQLEAENPGSFALQTVKIQDGVLTPVLTPVQVTTKNQNITNGYTYTYTYNIPSDADYGTYTLTARVKDRVGIDGSNHDISKVVYYKVKPAAPTGLTVSGENTTQLNLSWEAPQNGGLRSSNRYAIERKPASEPDTAFVQVALTSETHYANTGLTMNTGYTYRVRAYDVSSNAGEYSGSVSYTTPTPATPDNSTVKIIDASTVESNENRFLLVWDEPTANTDDNTTTNEFVTYVVEKSEDNGLTYTGSFETTNRHFVDVGLSSTTDYAYRIRTKDSFDHLSRSDLSPVKYGRPGAKPSVTITGESASTSTANIRWTATQEAETTILYDTNATKLQNVSAEVKIAGVGGRRSAGVEHDVDISGLTPNTTYFYKVVSRNALGFANDPEIRTLRTKNFVIQHSKNADVSTTTTTATIRWKTGEVPSDSFVEYQLQAAAGLTGSSQTAGTGQIVAANEYHTVSMIGLKPNSRYSYKIRSMDAGKYVVDSTLDYFETKAYDSTQFTIAPDASSVAEENITATSAKIVWSTAVPTTTWVDYGLESGKYGQAAGEDKYNTVHVVELLNLTPGKTYFYRVRGIDSNDIEYTSKEYSFTAILKPTITTAKVENVTPYTATIAFDTNVDTEATVVYGKTKEFGSKAGNLELARNHKVELSDLEDNSTYYYYIEIKDKIGNVYKNDVATFATPFDKEGPKVEGVKVDILPLGENDTKAQAIISWKTSKPATTKVEYTEGLLGSSYDKATSEDVSLNTSHTVIIRELEPSTNYRFRINSKDKRGNETKTTDYNFLTPSKERSIWQLIVKSLEETFSWVRNVGSFFRGRGTRAD